MTYVNQTHKMTMEAHAKRSRQYGEALCAPIFTTEEKAKKWYDEVTAPATNEGDRAKEVQAKALTYLAKAINVGRDFSAGRIKENPILNKTFTFDRSGSMPELYRTGIDEFAALQDWRLFLREVQGGNSLVYEFVDWFNVVPWEDLVEGQDIPITYAEEDKVYQAKYQRRGGGVSVGRKHFEANGYLTLNDIIADIRRKAEEKRSELCFGVINGASGGSTESFSNSIVETANKAATNLVTALKAKGYMVSINTVFHMLVHPIHEAAVRASFGTVAGDNGNNIRLIRNVVPVFSFAAETTYGGAAAGRMMLPYNKSVFINWENPEVISERNFRRDSITVLGQEYIRARIFDESVIRDVNFA